MKQNKLFSETDAKTLFLEPRYRRLKLVAVIRGVLPSQRAGNGIFDIIREKEILSAWDIIRQGEMVEQKGHHSLGVVGIMKDRKAALQASHNDIVKGRKLQELDVEDLIAQNGATDRERFVALAEMLTKAGFLK